jgi:transposase InsO family protein
MASVKHLFTQAYRPQTNGKAERFIQTLLREWAYALPYCSSRQRRNALGRWIHHYNHRRSHAALNHKPPITRVDSSSEQRV